VASLQPNDLAFKSTAQALAFQSFSPQSSFIALLEYDQQNLTLTTHLKSGAIYQHKMVTPMDWTAMQAAQNHGSFWSRMIKGKKTSVKVKKVRAPNSGIKSRGLRA
jgi:hypothetical protein